MYYISFLAIAMHYHKVFVSFPSLFSNTVFIFLHLCSNHGWTFSPKTCCYRLFSIITGHGTENILPITCEILELVKQTTVPLSKTSCLKYLTMVYLWFIPENEAFVDDISQNVVLFFFYFAFLKLHKAHDILPSQNCKIWQVQN